MAERPEPDWQSLPGELIELPGAVLYHEPGFVARAQELFDTLVRTVAWRQERIRLYGREHPVPRLSAWYGDAGAQYRYSGLTLQPLHWLPPLQALRQRLQRHLGCRFNSVLLNYYRNGRDSMGLHADDEPELGPEPVIASVSLGAARRMIFRHRQRIAEPLSMELGAGSLLVMAGGCQANWRHELPKTRRPVHGRVNLTFRQVGVVRWSRQGM